MGTQWSFVGAWEDGQTPTAAQLDDLVEAVNSLINIEGIRSVSITDAAVTTAKIADSSSATTGVTGDKIEVYTSGSTGVTTAKIADSTGTSDGVTSLKIEDSSSVSTGVIAAKIADSTGASDGVTAIKIADSTGASDGITTAKLFTSTGVGDGVTDAKFDTRTISLNKHELMGTQGASGGGYSNTGNTFTTVCSSVITAQSRVVWVTVHAAAAASGSDSDSYVTAESFAYGIEYRLKRDSTVICNWGHGDLSAPTTAARYPLTASMEFIDISPTTGSITYSLEARALLGVGAVAWNYAMMSLAEV